MSSVIIKSIDRELVEEAVESFVAKLRGELIRKWPVFARYFKRTVM
jgi:hypothetical protein